MYLKKLELKGFKSFADNTEIYLRPGINVVVGPNGCGKSNLVDAIRWVLGEGNVRNLRGQKGEDVIFKGTDKTRALSMASVEMTVDNIDNILPLDYSEVTVARKVFRTGESEFLLNKSQVRMKDINKLFMGTGLGKRGYSIISQGELEQVLNGQPIDRRLILEEASGVIKYRHQRDVVKKRISDTKQDLLRLADILAELTLQQGELALKAEKAKEHIRLSQEQARLEQELLKFETNKVLKDYHNKLTNLEKLKKQWAELKNLETDNIGHLDHNEKLLAEARLELNRLKETVYLTENKQQSLIADIRISEERIKSYTEGLKTAEIDAEKYKEMLANISLEVANRQSDLQAQKIAYEQKKGEYNEIVNELRSFEHEIGLLKEKFEAEKAYIFTHLEDEAKLKNDINEKENTISRIRERGTRLTIKKDELAHNINFSRHSLLEMEEEISELTLAIQAISAEENNLQENKADCWAKLQVILQAHRDLENELRLVENRLLTIKDSEEKLMGYSAAVKEVLSLQNSFPGIMGIVGEVIRVADGLEIAIETAAGRGLENIIVERTQDAQRIVTLLKENKMGRVTLLPLDILKVAKLNHLLLSELKKEKGVLGIASELIQYEAKFQKPISYIFGRTLIVEDMPISIYLFKKYKLPFRIVTLEGEILNTSGAITGGSHRKAALNSPLKRKNEERKLTQKAEVLRQSIADKYAAKIALDEKLDNIESELTVVTNTNIENKFKLELLYKQLKARKDELDNLINSRTNLLNEIETLNQNKNNLGGQIISLQGDLAKMQETSTKTTEQLELTRAKIDSRQRDYEVGKARLSSYQDYLLAKEQELNNIEHSMGQFMQVKDSYYDSMHNAMASKNRLIDTIKKEEAQIVMLTEANAECTAKLVRENQTIKDQQLAVAKYETEIKQFKNLINPIRQDISKLESSIHNYELNLTRLEAGLSNLHEKWQDIFDSKIPENIEVSYTNQEIKTFAAHLAKIKEDLSLLGPVDLGAIQEYQVITERVGFLSSQLDDLTEGQGTLEELLEKTERIMLREFRQFFAMANESFSNTFTEIFEGGEAFFTLEEEDDSLAAGVNIQVKLPGKRTQSLNLLSGGERALTCIAFIFALLRLRPAPFCLLDEIDATLDETNLVRFSNFLKNMAQNMQFIIITHRQTTIASGDNLYGVTMPEKGISTILTLDLSEAEGLAG